MKMRLAEFIVNRRKAILIIMVIIAAVCGLLIPRVPIETDMASYLPSSSPMRTGKDLLERELPAAAQASTVRVMFKGLTDEQKAQVEKDLAAIPDVSSVTYEADSPDYNKDDYTLFVVGCDADYGSEQEKGVEEAIGRDFSSYEMVYKNDAVSDSYIPLQTLAIAICLLLIVLVVMSASWVEPVLFLFTIGCAVLINMGTNLFVGSIAQVTFSIAAVLQLVLSMDYSIILMNRYRQELAAADADADDLGQRVQAMKRAVARALPSIASSSLTTFVGLLALVFMTFKIGANLGIVLAKGVLISLICVITIMPGLTVALHRAISRSAKPAPRPRLGWLATFEHRARYVLSGAFVVLFAAAFLLRGTTDVAYTLSFQDAVAQVFPTKTQLALVYANEDEGAVADVLADVENDPAVGSLAAWSTTLGKSLTASEAAEEFGVSAREMAMLYALRKADTMTVQELVDYLADDVLTSSLMSAMVDDDQRAAIEEAQATMQAAEAKLRGDHYSLASLALVGDADSQEVQDFVAGLKTALADAGAQDFYLVGDAEMVAEMKAGFSSEVTLITLISAIAIFVVVLATFRTLVVPLLLVLVVQCGVYLTVVAIGLQGYSIYYLAMLIVQCILMGATIDYGILYANNYREARQTLGVRDSLATAYRASINTVLTSGLIIVLVTGALAFASSEPVIAQICQTISIGAACAILLILVFLPGMLAAFDRFTAGVTRGEGA